MSSRKILLKLQCFDHRALDKGVEDIIKISGGSIDSVVPMPRKKRKITLNESTHVYGYSKKHYSIVSYRRCIWMSPSQDQIRDLMNLSLPNGVEVVILVLNSDNSISESEMPT